MAHVANDPDHLAPHGCRRFARHVELEGHTLADRALAGPHEEAGFSPVAPRDVESEGGSRRGQVVGANVAGFVRVADAMVAYGAV